MACIPNVGGLWTYRWLWILFWALFVAGMVAMIAGVCSGQPPQPENVTPEIPDIPDAPEIVSSDYIFTGRGLTGKLDVDFSNFELGRFTRGLGPSKAALVADGAEAVYNGVKATGKLIGNAVGGAISAVQDVDMAQVSLTKMATAGAIGGVSTIAVGYGYAKLVDHWGYKKFGNQVEGDKYNLKPITQWIMVILLCYTIGAICGGLYGKFMGGNDNKMKYAALWAWAFFIGTYLIQRSVMFGIYLHNKNNHETYDKVKFWGKDPNNYCSHCHKHKTMIRGDDGKYTSGYCTNKTCSNSDAEQKKRKEQKEAQEKQRDLARALEKQQARERRRKRAEEKRIKENKQRLERLERKQAEERREIERLRKQIASQDMQDLPKPVHGTKVPIRVNPRDDYRPRYHINNQPHQFRYQARPIPARSTGSQAPMME